jgi:Uma2 family endonuclease
MSEPASHDSMTVEDLRHLPDDDSRYELVGGHLVREPPPGGEHGGVSATVTAHLHAFVRAHRLGRVFGETGYVLASHPDTVRGPDASFVSADRLATLPRRGPYLVGAPDLAIEVVSPGNTKAEIAAKVREYLAAGGRAVWVIDPRRESVTVHRPDRVPATVGPSETLDGGDTLPGFRLPVSELFETY